MKNKNEKWQGFTSAKLPVKNLRLLAIIAIVTVIWFTFTACGDELCTHEWQWVETTPATLAAGDPPVETAGEETETCSICGETGETRPVTFRSYYYGTWTCETGSYAPYTVTVSATEIKRADKDGDYIKYTDILFTPAANKYSTFTGQFPIGHTFTGTRTDQGFEGVLGFIAISADRQSLYLTPSATEIFVNSSVLQKKPE